MSTVTWKPAIKGAKRDLIDKRLAQIDYDKAREPRARYDAQTTIYYKGSEPVFKVVHKTLTDRWNAYVPAREVYK